MFVMAAKGDQWSPPQCKFHLYCILNLIMLYSSPSADYHGRVLNVDCGGYVEYEECDYRYLGVRPVVSLKAGASVITTDEE